MTPYTTLRSALVTLSLAIALIFTGTLAMAQKFSPYPGTKIIKTSHGYKALVQRLGNAIKRTR